MLGEEGHDPIAIITRPINELDLFLTHGDRTLLVALNVQGVQTAKFIVEDPHVLAESFISQQGNLGVVLDHTRPQKVLKLLETELMRRLFGLHLLEGVV